MEVFLGCVYDSIEKRIRGIPPAENHQGKEEGFWTHSCFPRADYRQHSSEIWRIRKSNLNGRSWGNRTTFWWPEPKMKFTPILFVMIAGPIDQPEF